METCFVCNSPSSVSLRDSTFSVNCKVCGEYRAVDCIALEFSTYKQEEMTLVSGYIREQNLRNNTPTITNAEFVRNILSLSPKTVAEKIDRLLINLVRMSSSLGRQLQLGHESYPIGYARDGTELSSMMGYLGRKGMFVNIVGGLPCYPIVSAEAHMRVEEITNRVGSISNRAFVAMSFSKNLDEIYSMGLEPGIKEAGYNSVRVDKQDHIDKIDNLIILEIKRSKFMVADFTEQKLGVYYESGFADGLGIPVIRTCRRDEVDRLHFDTRQYNHILWESAIDLREQIKRSILANVGPGLAIAEGYYS